MQQKMKKRALIDRLNPPPFLRPPASSASQVLLLLRLPATAERVRGRRGKKCRREGERETVREAARAQKAEE